MKREWVVAACVVAGAAGLYVGRSAHAEPRKVSCETIYFEYEQGKAQGRGNVEALRAQVESGITAKMAAGFVYPVYASTFPIIQGSGTVIAQAGVACFAARD